MGDLEYDLEAIRNKMKKKKGGLRDPNEWRADKAKDTTLKWKFFILPPVDSMDLWYYEHGAHFIDNKVIECPRIHDDDNCPLCQYGFDLMKETNDKAERSTIARNYLASSRYAVNIYFPSIKDISSDLRGKVMWFSMPQSVYQMCEEVIMKDPPGDDEVDPDPYGVFFDPNNAIPFLLQAKKKGDYNSYESSRFINKKTPIAKSKDKIEEILDMRHDIPSLFSERDVDKLQEIVDKLTGNKSVSVKSDTAKKEPKNNGDEDEEKDELDLDDDNMEEADDTDTADEDTDDAIEETETNNEEASIDDDDDEDLASLLKELNSDD